MEASFGIDRCVHFLFCFGDFALHWRRLIITILIYALKIIYLIELFNFYKMGPGLLISIS